MYGGAGQPGPVTPAKDIKSMSYTERVALFEKSPELYNQMRG
jgi:hypothetical protein